MLEAIAAAVAAFIFIVLSIVAAIQSANRAHRRANPKVDLIAEIMAWQDGKTRMEYLRDLRLRLRTEYGIYSEVPDGNDCMTMSLRLNLGGDKPFRAPVETLEYPDFLASIRKRIKNDTT